VSVSVTYVLFVYSGAILCKQVRIRSVSLNVAVRRNSTAFFELIFPNAVLKIS